MNTAELLQLGETILNDGIGADGMSGTVDTSGPAGPSGGSPFSGKDEDQEKPPVRESDVLAFSGSGPTTTVDGSASLPWDRGSRKRKRVAEMNFWKDQRTGVGRVVPPGEKSGKYSGGFMCPDCFEEEGSPHHMVKGAPRATESLNEEEGFLAGHPTDATQTGKITIAVLDSTNLRVNAPSRILEQVEAYKLFEQFQILLPRTPMLNINVMESISSWWRNFAQVGDVLEIDCTNGQSVVVNEINNRIYSLGCLGNIPTSSGFVA